MKHLPNKVFTTIQKHNMLTSGMHICVCLSGGADSSVLLHVLFQSKEILGISLSACHFNHGIRGEEANRDQSFCKSLCSLYNIPFYECSLDLPALQPQSGMSMEEFARFKRYEWFESLRASHGIDRFATAHHMDDNAETVLFHVIRGTTLAGLAGIPVVRDHYIRPLAEVSKESILAYAEEHDLSFVEDSTNSCEDYTRNFLRHTVFPALQKVNPAAKESLHRLSRYASEDEAFLDSLLPPLEEIQAGKHLPPALLRRIISRNHQKITGMGLCYQHLDTIMEAVYSENDARFSLPGGYECIVKHGAFCICRKEKNAHLVLEPGNFASDEISLFDGMVIICRDKPKSPKFVYNLYTEILLSSEGIYGMIRYRSREPGDRLRLKGVNRSVKKLMSESKMPIALRNILPLFTDDRGIIAVPFVGVADRVYTKESKADLKIQIYIAEQGTRRVVENQ